MDKHKPLLSAIFFIGLSFWGIQLSQAAGTDLSPNSAEFLKSTTPDLPNSYQALAVVQLRESVFQDYALSLFTQVKSQAVYAFRQALSRADALGSLLTQFDFFGRLNFAFEPLIDETNADALKAALPTAVWLFLSGVLGLLGLKKRNTAINAGLY